LNEASTAEVSAVLDQPLADLDTYAQRMGVVVNLLEKRINKLRRDGEIGEAQFKLLMELERGLRVTAMRASHRSLTLRALLAKRGEHVGKIDHSSVSESLLAKARLVRSQAQAVVHRQESIYRYPVAQVARRCISMTSYPFGYLYPASNLFFWEREEKQVEHERFDALFMNLWDIRRTLGLESLFF
jgi:hypothetical protein